MSIADVHMIKGRKVLVTGAGGFIGSHLVERLVALGADVRAFVHYNALNQAGWLSQLPHVRNVDLYPGDLCDRDSVHAAVAGVDCVFHLGALIAIPYSYRAPASYIRVNVEGTLNILQAARDSRVRRVIHTSTSEVYGSARTVPMTESHPLQGQSPYSASKIGADKMAEAFHCSYGLPVVTIRPFNTYGPRQSARAIVPTIILQCLESGRIRLGNTHPTRDLNYVDDTVDGFVRAALAPGVEGTVINLGSGREVSIGELASMIAEQVNREIEVVIDDKRIRPAASEVDRLLADASLAAKCLDWKAAVSLESGLGRTIEWMIEHRKSYRADQYAV